MEAMITLAKREYNIQWTIVTENVIPPQIDGYSLPYPIRIPVEDPTIQEHHTVRNGHA